MIQRALYSAWLTAASLAAHLAHAANIVRVAAGTEGLCMCRFISPSMPGAPRDYVDDSYADAAVARLK